MWPDVHFYSECVTVDSINSLVYVARGHNSHGELRGVGRDGRDFVLESQDARALRQRGNVQTLLCQPLLVHLAFKAWQG
jgi:hypothetical protein